MVKIVVTNLKGGVGKSTLSSALADVLEGAQLVDLDHQGSITIAHAFTGRHRPVTAEEVTGRNVIFDTPPYLSERLPNLLRDADHVIIPTAVGQYDLLALKGVVDRIRKAGVVDKTWIVFNKVPGRSTKTLTRTKEFFIKNYKDIKKADQHLSYLAGFHTIAERPVWGKAKKEILSLCKEIGLIK